MEKNRIICAIEHALRDEGCCEISVNALFLRVQRLKGMDDLSVEELIAVLYELVDDTLYEIRADFPEDITGDSLVARSHTHPDVPPPMTEEEIEEEYQEYREVWQRALSEIAEWGDDEIEEFLAQMDQRPVTSTFFSGGPLQFVLEELLPPTERKNPDGTTNLRLMWELEKVISPNINEEFEPDFDWKAAKERVDAFWTQRGIGDGRNE
jgi:hypothetical protein